MNNLEINRENHGEEIILRCSGRLDANWAGHLNDYIEGLVREGHYFISLNLTGIEYLSSAGIRSLVTQYKNLLAINGHFHIMAMADNVKEVLNMVGMLDMLCQLPKKTETVNKGDEKDYSNHLSAFGFKFERSELSAMEKSDVEFYGQPELIKQSGFTASHSRFVKSEENHFSLGLGAIGESFEESKNRFGEYLMVGKNIAYLPADGSKKPDYMVSHGRLVASLTELYGLHFKGNFSHLIRFEPEVPKATIGLSELATTIHEFSGNKQFALVMIAESAGLIGTSLNTSPVDGRKLFSYPEIKETVNFTTEPVYSKMLTLSVGYFSGEDQQTANPFLRPLQAEGKLSGHVHSAIFPYIPLKKTDIDLNETIDFLFNSSELTDILHLTNDTREITGLGESQFVQGFCWIVPIESTNHILTQ